jgi:hypothetical protein
VAKATRVSREFLSRDINYLRDLGLFWPFALSTTFAVASAFSPGNSQLAIRFAVVAIVALLLAREKLLLLIAALMYVLIHCAYALVLHPWSWTVFAVGILTGVPLLAANRSWRNPKFSYRMPTEAQFGAVDLLWCAASTCATFFIIYLISPYN